MKIGIRKEDKGRYERRAPFAPEHIKQLVNNGFDILVEKSPVRAYKENEYEKAGANIVDNLDDADFIFGVKEIPLEKFSANKSYFFFSHTIKGQIHNMPALKKMMDLNITLIDYERITNNSGQRLVFFGPFAGNAGMIDALWGLGKKWQLKGYDNPFLHVKQTFDYYDLKEAKSELQKIGTEIRDHGFHPDLGPVIIGFTGYGNVSLGAQDVLAQLPIEEVGPEDLLSGKPLDNLNIIYKVVFTLNDLYAFKDGALFDKFVFFNSPEQFKSKSNQYWPHLTLLVNAVYWSEKADRIVSRKDLLSKQGKLEFISDISCDIDGGIEVTTEATSQDSPFLTFDREKNVVERNLNKNGIAVLAVDNLPCELSIDATRFFGDALTPLVLKAGQNANNINDLPEELRRAVILDRGRLTENYRYLEQYI